MAGFFGLFGKKTKYVDDPTPVAPDPKENNEAFFLDSDSAKTLGNIDFMRNPKVIRRSFPKTLKGKEADAVTSISSLSVQSLSAKEVVAQSSVFEENGQGTAKSPDPLTERKQADSSLDVFRQMAKDIKK